MYLTSGAIAEAIEILHDTVHPFLGITFLACKRFGLTVGRADAVSLDAITHKHLEEFHVLDRRSRWFFQPFKSANYWVTERYASTGLQTVNTQTFNKVFIHPPRSKFWGFATDYIELIADRIRQKGMDPQVSALALAIWIFKDEDLGPSPSFRGLTSKFIDEFHITDEELSAFFHHPRLELGMSESAAFSDDLPLMPAVLRKFDPAPDAPKELGTTLSSLRLENLAPAPVLEMAFGERLSVVTGDNGLGKSFLLETAWWAATGSWVDRHLMPPVGTSANSRASIRYRFRGARDEMRAVSASFDLDLNAWMRPEESRGVEALCIFSRADGSFGWADPYRNSPQAAPSKLSAQDVWDGRPGVIEGLVRDWIRWQQSADSVTFDRFKDVLRRLSPEDLGTLAPGEPIRLRGDPRQIPTVQHRYGSIPVTQASSGVQRVLLLAYLLIWIWQEHEVAAEQLGRPPLRRMLVLVDEIEAHLHPKWQRIVLPALLRLSDVLSPDLAIQMVAATHSPMILASLENAFEEQTDVLYHLFASARGVHLEELPFVKYGDASAWLTSPLFGLRHARSKEAERAIDEAKALQLSDEISPEQVASVSSKLKEHLAADDKFWPRWLYYAERHGVVL
jgi:hypothetical protein